MHVLISALHRPIKPTGVCRHAANLARCLADTAIVTKVTLLIGSWQEQYFATSFNLCSDKINIVNIDIKNSSLARNRWFLWGLPKVAAQLQPDIVHLSFPMPFIRSQFRCPVVSTIHDLYPYECPENFGKIQALFNRAFLRQCIQESDGLACVSQTTLDRFKFFFPKNPPDQKLAVIYNIVDFHNIQPQIPRGLPEQASKTFLLTVAQHRKNKNLDLLINAYNQLLKTQKIDSATQLVIVGSPGPETENLTKQIQDLQLQTKVQLLASIEDSELCWLYQNCQAFVIPSSNEGFCIPLAEALYLSCKAVCSDIPIFREVGSPDCAYFTFAENPVQNLAEAIAQVMQQPPCTYQPAQFSQTVVAQQYLQLYAELTQKSVEHSPTLSQTIQ